MPLFTGLHFGFGAAAGAAAGPTAFTVTGGDVDGQEPGNGYKYHTFTGPGTLTVTDGPLAGGTIEYLVIGGGGG